MTLPEHELCEWLGAHDDGAPISMRDNVIHARSITWSAFQGQYHPTVPGS